MSFSILALITFYSSIVIGGLAINLELITTAFSIVGSTFLVVLFVPYQVYRNYIAQSVFPSPQKPDAFDNGVYRKQKKEIIASADDIREKRLLSSAENQNQLLNTLPQSIKNETGLNSFDESTVYNRLNTLVRHSQYTGTQIISGLKYPQMRVCFKSGEYEFFWIPKWYELDQILESAIEIENSNLYQSEWKKILSDIKKARSSYRDEKV